MTDEDMKKKTDTELPIDDAVEPPPSESNAADPVADEQAQLRDERDRLDAADPESRPQPGQCPQPTPEHVVPSHKEDTTCPRQEWSRRRG